VAGNAVSNFVASRDALGFVNNWPSQPDVVINLPVAGKVKIGDASNGLCGGMVYTVRDFYEAKIPMSASPQPVAGTPLYAYIVRRLFDSFDLPGGVVKYYNWMNMPDADQSLLALTALTRRGIGWHTINEEWPQIRDDVDAGHPCPLGLVTVPVKLYSAIDRKTVRFHQLSGKTGVRVAQKRVDPKNDEEVPYEHIVKGFELAPDRYVVVKPEELDALQPEKTRTIEIEDFVELAQIDPIFYDHSYYLAPGPGGAKPYLLLLEAMRETGKVAIARVVIRNKEQLVAIRPMGDVLVMSTMLFPDEVLPPERLEELSDGSSAKTNKREVDIAKQLVGSLAGDFKPDKYRDTYRQQVLELIERKAHGEKIAVQPPPEEVRAPAPDLMSALKASLDAVRAQDAEADGKGAKRAKPAAKKAARKAAAKKPAAKKAASRAPAKR